MLSLLAPRSAHAARPADGPYHDPGILAFALALAGAVRRTARRVAEAYWSGHRKGVRIQALSSTSCLPYTHG